MTAGPQREAPAGAERGDPAGPRRLVALGIAAVLAVSLGLRFVGLDRHPGINADEAYFPVQVQRALAGEDFTLRAPTGLFADPITVGSQALLLSVLEPSFLLLRLPTALLALLGVWLAAALHARTHGSRAEGWLVAALTACLPLHVAYSRCGWVPSLVLLAAPLVWFPAQAIAEGRARRRDAVLLAAGACLCLAVHLTSGAYLVGVAAALLCARRGSLLGRGPKLLLAGLAAAAAFAALAAAARFPLARLREAAAEAAGLLLHPLDALSYVGLAGRFLWGSRAGSYFAGTPPSTLQDLLSIAALLAALACALRLVRSPSGADRFTGAFWLLVPLLLLATKGLTGLQVDGRERYVLWLLVAFPTLVVRAAGGARAAAVLGLCAALLLQTWTGYLEPVRTQAFADSGRLHPTFWTGEREPKAEAADRIRALARDPASTVYAEDFWLQQPLQYLLGPGRAVRTRIPATALSSTGEWFAVGFSGSPFARSVRAALEGAGRRFEEIPVEVGGRRILSVLRVESTR